MEEFILNFVNFIGHLDFGVVLRIFLILFAIFWIFIVLWVWFDAGDKSNKILFRIFSVFVVLVFNILGLIIYFLIRPAESYEERYWQELEKRYLEFETGGLMNCSKCNFELEPSFIICPNCGKDLKTQCENCNKYIDKKWKFCAFCGFKRNVPESKAVEESKKEKKKKKGKKFQLKDLNEKKKNFLIYVGRLKRRQSAKIGKIKAFIREGDNSQDKKVQEEKGEKKSNKKSKKV